VFGERKGRREKNDKGNATLEIMTCEAVTQAKEETLLIAARVSFHWLSSRCNQLIGARDYSSLMR